MTMKKIHLVCGPQGSGKSTYSKNLSDQINGVHLSIDKWMWQLYGEDLPEPMNLNWIMKRVERCEKQIWEITNEIVSGGREVVLDLGFTSFEKRALFQSLAREKNITTQLHYIKSPHLLRRKRVLERNIEKGPTFSFEVTPGMFDFMETQFQPPTGKELEGAIIIDTSTQ